MHQIPKVHFEKKLGCPGAINLIFIIWFGIKLRFSFYFCLVLHPYIVLFGTSKNFIKSHKSVISSDGIFLQVTKVNVRSNKNLESVFIIPVDKTQRKKAFNESTAL